VKFKAFGLDIDPEKAIKASRELAKEAQAEAAAASRSPLPWWRLGWSGARRPPDAVAARESLYYDAQTQLLALTEPTQGVKLRIVVLIDDLDRCLPEKAIQVPESVKLFLNVAGFSFVLAVDDEVVERGIAHRYKDYRLAAGSDGAVRLWALQADGSARESARLQGHEGGVLSVAFNPDGKTLASAGADGCVRLWSADTDGRWRAAANLIGRGLDVVDEATPTGSKWLLRRTDGQPFESQLNAAGERLLADPMAYPWLWFSGVNAEGDYISVPAIDVPPSWIKLSTDGLTIRVDRAARTVPPPTEGDAPSA
jgi:hypothetical protein